VHYPPREIKQPASLKKVEICSRSGLLATDKCYDAVKTAAGDLVQRRTTYMEIGTAAQLPTEPCNVHGEPRTRLVHELPSEGELPRAELAVDVSQITPVVVNNPTLLAEKDPYNSVKASAKPQPEPEKEAAEKQKIDDQTPEPAVPIRKAIPVEPQEEKPVEIRRAEPVGPLDEVPDDSLLKAETPPPTDLGD
jgi:hypothetical protein